MGSVLSRLYFVMLKSVFQDLSLSPRTLVPEFLAGET